MLIFTKYDRERELSLLVFSTDSMRVYVPYPDRSNLTKSKWLDFCDHRIDYIELKDYCLAMDIDRVGDKVFFAAYDCDNNRIVMSVDEDAVRL